jgi:hypothetical protein
MVYTTDLKSVASNGLRVQVPPLVPYPDSIMDNTKSFYLLNVGSIPARGARIM